MGTVGIVTAIALFVSLGLTTFGDLIALIVETADGNEYHDTLLHQS